MTASLKRQLRAQFAGDEFTDAGELTDDALALRLQAMAVSNGAAFDRHSRNRFLQEAARRLRERERGRQVSVKQVDTWKFTDTELDRMVDALESAAAERQHSRYGTSLRDELVAAQAARARREASRD